MEDTVVGALNRKCPRSSGAKRVSSKYAPQEKRPNTTENVSPLKALMPPLFKVDETSGAASNKVRTIFPPLAD